MMFWMMATPGMSKQGRLQGKCGKSGGGGSGGGKLAKEADKMKSARDSSRGSGGQRRECWVCGDPDHLYYECPDPKDSDKDDNRGGRGRSVGGRPHRDNKLCKEKQSSLVKDVDSSYGGKARGDGEASCSMFGVVEPSVLLASEAGEDFKAVVAAVQANPSVRLTWLAFQAHHISAYWGLELSSFPFLHPKLQKLEDLQGIAAG
ncbi:unnamed protein product [Closterium sp. NIES-54]